MRIGFVTMDLTHLRYFIPFSRKLHEFIPEVDQAFYLPRGNHKYNGLRDESNFNICRDRIERYCPYARLTDGNEQFDIAIQVEVGRHLDATKRIAIQHGFDYAYKTAELKSQVDAYICSSEITATDATRLGVVGSVVSPFPVCLWDIDLKALPPAPEKSVLVFYPDAGDNDLVRDVVDDLLAFDRVVFVKQRRKHQPIKCGGNHLYDTVWYPSEAITIPLSVEWTIGFGSSAYTDLVPAGVDYINVDIHSTRAPWNAFVHPIATNYVRMTDESDVRKSLALVVKHASRTPRRGPDNEQLREFMLKLIG